MAHKVDQHVGQRIRQRRWLIGMTQQALAECVGIKFQQIQKYETGINRVSASRLWDIGHAMGVHVHFFFDGLDHEDDANIKTKTDLPIDLLQSKDTADLIRAYYTMPETQRRRLLELARVLGDVA